MCRRVRQLEGENAHLQQLAERGAQYDDLRSEIEQLRTQLQAAENRELQLSMELTGHSATSSTVKTAMNDCLSSASDPLESQASSVTLDSFVRALFSRLSGY